MSQKTSQELAKLNVPTSQFLKKTITWKYDTFPSSRFWFLLQLYLVDFLRRWDAKRQRKHTARWDMTVIKNSVCTPEIYTNFWWLSKHFLERFCQRFERDNWKWFMMKLLESWVLRKQFFLEIYFVDKFDFLQVKKLLWKLSSKQNKLVKASIILTILNFLETLLNFKEFLWVLEIKKNWISRNS